MHSIQFNDHNYIWNLEKGHTFKSFLSCAACDGALDYAILGFFGGALRAVARVLAASFPFSFLPAVNFTLSLLFCLGSMRDFSFLGNDLVKFSDK